MEVLSLTADNWRMDGGVAFGVVPKVIWTRFIEADSNNCVQITTRCLLIRNSDKNILIDVGFGNKRDDKYYKIRSRDPEISILGSLAKIGVTPLEITDIIFTHLHDDHVEGATYVKDNQLFCTFPNALYWVSELHWNWALNPNKREAAAYFHDNLFPLRDSGRLRLLKENEQPFDGIFLKKFFGHTEGQLIPFITYKGKTLVFLADFIPTSFNISLAYIPSVDIQPLITLNEKELFLQEAVENGYILVFEHDFYFECATLIRNEKGIVIDKTFNVNDI